jgi:hypothetical protein
MNIIPFGDKYNIHIIDSTNYPKYELFLSKITICDPTYLSKSFEMLSYSSLEDENNIGFFLTNKTNDILYSSVLLDLECSKNEEVIIEHGYSLEECSEITLLCANYKKREPGLTGKFVNFLINNMIRKYKPTTKYIFLYVAQTIENNPNAYNFYVKMGFTLLSDNKSVMIYTYKGGKKRKTYKHKTNKNKTNKYKTNKSKYKRHKTHKNKF